MRVDYLTTYDGVFRVVLGLARGKDTGPEPFGFQHSNHATRVRYFCGDEGADVAVTLAVGESAQWGSEACLVIECATHLERAKRLAERLCREFEQEAVYVTIDGANPQLWWAE